MGGNGLRHLIGFVPLDVAASTVSGLMAGAVFGFTAVYGTQVGLSVPQTAAPGEAITLDDLGARTAPDGRLIDRNEKPVPGLSLLGRLALGSVIAADSLHDCFGEASSRWADGVLRRID